MIKNIFKHGLEALAQKMALIPREEFDIQTEVLKRAYQKLEELERRVAILEKSKL